MSLLFALGCNSDGSSKPEGSSPTPQQATPAADRSECTRKNLVGTPLEGPGTEKLKSLLSGAVADACMPLSAVSDFNQALEASQEAAGARQRPRLPDSCGPFVTLLDEAVLHEENCSPWLGAPPVPLTLDDVELATRIATVASMRAWTQWEGGEHDASLVSVLNCIRLGQDLVRGASAGEILLGIGVSSACLESAQSLLDAPGTAISNDYDWHALITALEATTPSALAAIERDISTLTSALPTSKQEKVRKILLEAKNAAVAACNDVSPKECNAALLSMSEEAMAQNSEEVAMAMSSLQRSMTLAQSRLLWHVRKLAGLRLHVSLLSKLTQASCPTLASFEQPPLLEMLDDPASDATLLVMTGSKGLAIWASDADAALPIWEMRCGLEQPGEEGPATTSSESTLTQRYDHEITQKGEWHYAISRSLLEAIGNNPMEAIGRSRIEPAEGEPGLNLFRVRPGTLLHRLGFKVGDRVVSLNGQSTSSFFAGSEIPAYKALAGKHMRFELVRESVQQILVIDIDSSN